MLGSDLSNIQNKQKDLIGKNNFLKYVRSNHDKFKNLIYNQHLIRSGH